MAPSRRPDTTYFSGFGLDDMAASDAGSLRDTNSSRSGSRRYGSMGGQSQSERPTFSSKAGLILSCLGCVVGTGNIWRFPRIVANNAQDEGGLVFLLVWFLFLLLWSIPMITIEYATGRYTGKAVVASFRDLVGDKAAWCGLWVCLVSFFIGCYYSVILGWCMYYLVYCLSHDLPTRPEDGQRIFTDFAQESHWPILTTGLAVTLACVCVIKGVKTIEKVCMALVPVLLLILTFTFVWALTRAHSDLGLLYLFTPNWASLAKPRLWVDALSQNAFDTGAGAGLLVPYASYMTRNHGIVRYSTLIPTTNNIVSLIAGMTIFSAVFSTMIVLEPQYSQEDIVDVLMNSGPGNTGLTFIWLPVLFNTVGVLGRVVACLFFLCLTFAGLTSLIATVELVTHTVEDFGVRRIFAVLICFCSMFGISQMSANNLNILTNQDFVWGFGLIINGMMFMFLVYAVGVRVYREEMINDFGTDDWDLAVTWDWVIKYLAPVEAVALIIWWAVDLITSQTGPGPKWYELGKETFMMTILQWVGIMALLLTGNMVAVHCCRRRKYLTKEEKAEIKAKESSRLIVTTHT